MNHPHKFLTIVLAFGLITAFYACTEKEHSISSLKQEMLNDPLTKEYVVSFRKIAAAQAEPNLRAQRKNAKTNDEVKVFNATIKTANGKTLNESMDDLSKIYMKLGKKYMKDKNMAHQDFREVIKLGLKEERKGADKDYIVELKNKLKSQTKK